MVCSPKAKNITLSPVDNLKKENILINTLLLQTVLDSTQLLKTNFTNL